MHFSDWFGLPRGHINFEFVDCALNCDNELFIDPMLLELNNDSLCVKANKRLSSFMDVFYSTLRNGDISENALFSHFGEQNATKLGYGNGRNGKGTTQKGFSECIRGLSRLVSPIPTIDRITDLPVLVKDLAEDKLSDIITNVIHDLLIEFTLIQMAKLGIESNGSVCFWCWDDVAQKWVHKTMPGLLYNGEEVLLVPKHIVRKNYLFSTHQYFTRVILERKQAEDTYRGWSKKDIISNYPHPERSWERDTSIEHTLSDPSILSEYHDRLPGFYHKYKDGMTDAELDRAVYGKAYNRSA